MGNSIKMICKFLGLVFMTGAFTYASADTIRQLLDLTDGE